MKLENLQGLEKLINSELASKIQMSEIKNSELLFEVNEEDLIEVIQFIKSNDKCKFKQLIDIVCVDYPDDDKRFQLVYLFLSHELNLRVKLRIKVDEDQVVNSITKISPSANWMEREVFDMYGIKFKNPLTLEEFLQTMVLKVIHYVKIFLSLVLMRSDILKRKKLSMNQLNWNKITEILILKVLGKVLNT